MRKFAFGLALVFAIGLIAVPAMAEEGEFTSDGDMRLRWDFFNNFTDAQDNDANTTNDSYDLFPYRARLGVQGRFTDRAWGRVELQAAGWFGDPLGQTGYPYPSAGAGSVGIGFVQLYQGYVTVEGGTFDFTAGRKEVVLGNELILGNNDFYNGRVFDGIDVTGDFSSWDLNLYYKHLAETFAARGDAMIWGADAVINIGNTHIDPYLLLTKNFGATSAISNIPAGAEIYTFGINWERPINEDHTGWDVSLEAAGQFGDFGPGAAKIDAAGYVFEGWFGWSFGNAGRVHVGYFLASGDDGSDPTETSAFIPLFEDPHAYNRLGNLDLFAGFAANAADPLNQGMSNIQDINLGYNWWGGDRHHALVAVHWLSRPEIAAYGANVSDEIGYELDLSYDYMYARNSKLEVGVSTLFTGDFFDTYWSPDNTDNITRIWAQVHLNWGK